MRTACTALSGILSRRTRLKGSEGKDRELFAEVGRELHNARERREQGRMDTRAECQRAMAEMIASTS